MKPKDFTSHKHVAVARGAQGGRVPASCPTGFQGRYTVQPGDTMFFIAQRFGVSLDSLIAANPHIADPNVIFPGDVLCVPGPPVGGRVPASCPPGFQGRYTVQPGDSMFSIAQKFGVSLDALIAANPHITDPNVIFPGDVLCVPQAGGRVPASCPPGFQGRYTVQPGDTMFSIAQKFGVSLDALIAANPHITNPNVIFPGDVLCVPEKLVLPCCSVMKSKIHPIPGSDPAGVVLARFLSTNQESVSILAEGLPDPEDLDNYNGYQGVIRVPEQAEIAFPLIKVYDNLPHSTDDSENPSHAPYPPHPSHSALWVGTRKLATILTLDTKILVRAYKTGGGAKGTTVLSTDLKNCRAVDRGCDY